jgi:hypothetical protein
LKPVCVTGGTGSNIHKAKKNPVSNPQHLFTSKANVEVFDILATALAWLRRSILSK